MNESGAHGDQHVTVCKQGFATLVSEGSLRLSNGGLVDDYPQGVNYLIIKNGLKRVRDFSFEFMRDLKAIDIPPSLEVIGARAFADCALQSVYFPDGIKRIGNHAFANCKSLDRIMLPATLENFGMCVFEGCDALEYMGVDGRNPIFYSESDCIMKRGELGPELVAGCKSSLIPQNCKKIAPFAFSQVKDFHMAFIPDCTELIDEFAFDGCRDLTTVTFGEGNLIIAGRAFVGCKGLRSVALGDGSVSIGDYAFSDCTNLRRVYIPYSVRQLGHKIFDSCENLTEIYCEAERKPMGWRKDWIDGCNADVFWNANRPVKKLRRAYHRYVDIF